MGAELEAGAEQEAEQAAEQAVKEVTEAGQATMDPAADPIQGVANIAPSL